MFFIKDIEKYLHYSKLRLIFTLSKKTNTMTTSKNVILTAINFKGIDQVKKEAKELADNLLCSESYVKNIIRQVEKNQIVIRKGY